MSQKKIEDLIAKAGIAINNSLKNNKLQTHFAEYGYTVEKISTGKTLLTELVDLNIAHAKEWGEKEQATSIRDTKREQANKTYMRHLKIARIAFNNQPGVWQALALGGDRKDSFSGWMTQVKQFYTNLKTNQSWLEAMAGYGITPEKLDEAQLLLNNTEQAQNQQKTEMGEAQEATRLRDKAADTLQEWYSDFIAIARIALEDEPQLLEMLGIVKK